MPQLQATKPTIEDRIRTLCAFATMKEHELITLIREFDDSGAWARQGCLTCAHWLSWKVGMGPAAGRERIRVAKALGEMKKIDAHFAEARISYSKVRAITRVATAENEALLLDIARYSTASQLESFCSRFRSCMQADKPQASELKRRVSVRYDDDGTMRINVVLPADEGARLLAAVESGRAVLDEESDDVSAESETGPLNYIDNAGGRGVSKEAARTLCCDASISTVVADGQGHVLDVGRKRRFVHEYGWCIEKVAG